VFIEAKDDGSGGNDFIGAKGDGGLLFLYLVSASDLEIHLK